MNKDKYILLVSILLTLSLITYSIIYNRFNIIYILIFSLIINSTLYILFNIKTIRIDNILYVINNSIIFIIILRNYENISIIIFSMIISLFLFYLLFRKFINFPFHPVLITLVLITISFPESYFDNTLILNGLTIENIPYIINSIFITHSIGNSMFIILFIIGIIYMFVQKHNIYLFLTIIIGYIIFSFFTITFNGTFYFNSFLIIGSIYLITDSNYTTGYVFNSILSGIICSLLIFSLYYFFGLDRAIIFSFIIISILNPIIDKKIQDFKNKFIIRT